MRGRHLAGEESGSALQRQGKSRYPRGRSLVGGQLLRLLVLLTIQQGFSMVNGRVLSRTILQPAAVVGSKLFAAQAAQAQPAAPVPIVLATTKPSKPTNFTATAGNGRVTLEWGNPCDSSITGYQFRQRKGSGNWGDWTNVSNANGKTRSHTVTGLDNGSRYRFRIRARNDAGNSVPSDVKSATPTPGTGQPFGIFRIPATMLDNDCEPVLKPIEDRTIWQGQTVDVKAVATDADGDAISYAWTRKVGERTPAMPPGVNLSADRLNFIPPAIGTYTMTVTANDGNGHTDTEDVTITVLATNVVAVPAARAVGEGDGNAVVTITAAEAFGASTTFNVTYGSTSVTTDTDATGANDPAAGDYDNDAVTSVTFSATDTTKDITIPITDDGLDEPTETFTVTIAPAATLPTGFSLGNATTTVTITDDDAAGRTATIRDNVQLPGTLPMLQLLTDPATVSEGTAISLTVTSDKALVGTLPVSLTLADRDSSGFDAADIPGSLGPRTFNAVFVTTPSTTGTVTILTSTDSEVEGAETYRVTLNDGSGYDLGADTNADGVLDDGSGTVSVPEALTVTEGTNSTATVQVTASQSLGTSATFNVTYGGTATGTANPADGDYDNDAVTLLTFAPSDTTKDIVIPITDDNLDEPDETITVTIALATSSTLPTGFSLGNATTTVTIIDNDEATATTVDPDTDRAAKARKQALATTSRAWLGMATDVLGSRSGRDCPVVDTDSLGEQALGVVENVLGISGSELPTDLTLAGIEDRLWSQSFHLTPAAEVKLQDREGKQHGCPSGQQRSWALWGAGELRSYRSEEDAEGLSSNGNLKTAWLGMDHRFTNPWRAGLALSFGSAESDYSYRKTDGATDRGKMSTQLTTVYPYGAVQLSEHLRLWGMAGLGFGSQQHRHSQGEQRKAEGDLRLRMGVIGFERAFDSIGELNLSLAGDVGLARSTTDWQDGSGLEDLSVSLHRARLGVDSSLALTGHTTGYLNLKGRMDGGDLPMNAAEIVAGLQYSQERFSGFLQGRQVYAFDGSYAESGLTAQLRFTSRDDGTGLGWTLQPSYGAGNGDVALAAGPSLRTDEQLESLTGSGAAQQRGENMEWSSRMGYGIRLQPGDWLLTPFTEVRLRQGNRHRVGLGLTLEGASWDVEFSGSSEDRGNASPTGKVQLNFSKRL